MPKKVLCIFNIGNYAHFNVDNFRALVHNNWLIWTINLYYNRFLKRCGIPGFRFFCVFNEGIIMLIPGGYYSVHLYYYFRAASPMEQ